MPMGEVKREDGGKLASANYEVKQRLTPISLLLSQVNSPNKWAYHITVTEINFYSRLLIQQTFLSDGGG